MKRVDPARRRAAELLVAWRDGERHIEELLETREARDREAGRELDYADRRRVRELVYGSVHHLGRYEHAIAMRMRRRKRLDDAPWAAMILGLHELFAMRTPDHAAVAQAAELCRALGGRHAVGFVNGVLRRVQREGLEHGFPAFERDPVGHLTHWLSHPRWLVERWVARFGADEARALCRFDNERRPPVLRALHGERDALLGRLAELDVDARASAIAPDAVILEASVSIPALLAQLELPVAVQDEAAQLVAPCVVAEKPSSLLDLCAAPGGKLAHMLALHRPERAVGCDDSARRMRRVAENLARLGGNAELVVADGRTTPFAAGSFAAVLVDAPCSGSGVLARRHDARWRHAPDDLDRLPALQRELLDRALDLAAPGGIVVYATCSLEPEENDAVVDAVLSARDDVEEIGLDKLLDRSLLREGRLATLPQRHGCDGAFAARLRKRESSA